MAGDVTDERRIKKTVKKNTSRVTYGKHYVTQAPFTRYLNKVTITGKMCYISYN